MGFYSRVLVPALLFLLATGPALAQRTAGASDVSGALPMSDASGALSQSNQMVFQSDEARIRMADVASILAQALREGSLGASLTGKEPMAVPDGTAPLLLASSSAERRQAVQQMTETMTTHGLPKESASAFVDAVAGILEGETVSSEQFLSALRTFNAAVDAAPASFLARPPQEFVVARTVLTILLDATAS